MYRCVPFLALLSVLACSCRTTTHPPRQMSAAPLVTWEKFLAETIRRDIFSPPQVARIFSYSQVAAYEAMRPSFPSYPSLKGRLKGLEKLPTVNDTLHFDTELATLTAYMKTARLFVYNEHRVDSFYKRWSDSLSDVIDDPETVKNSVAYGDSMAVAMKRWARGDRFFETRSLTRYYQLKEDYAWKPTPPNFEQAFEPYWGTVRTFVVDTNHLQVDLVFPKFDHASQSDFYKAAYETYEIGKSGNDSLQQIAFYWDDNPNTTIRSGHLMFKVQKHSPVAHWMLIAGNATADKKFDAPKTAYTLAMTAVGMHDALVHCWRCKFHYNSIRPVTYINRYIDPYWQPIIETPPFPETPSGHATVSRAAAVILTDLIGDGYAFTDSTENQFDLGTRNFTSFREAAEQAKMSRLYGGIHFRFGNETGALLGDTIGKVVCEKLRLGT